MLNAPFADGRGRPAAYYPPPPSLFLRQEQLKQAFPLVSSSQASIRQGEWSAGYLPVPSGTGTQQDMLNLHSSGHAEKNDSSKPMRQHSDAFLQQQQKIREQFEKNRKAALKKAEAEAKSRPPEGKGAALKPDGKNSPVQKPDSKSEKLVKSDKKAEANQVPKKPQNEKEGWFKGSASTLIGAFKVGSALIITGGINAFLFGVPLKTAALVSGLVAGSQSLTALKIHRENNEFSRKLIGFTRKLMGRENDMTPSGKEWSMVPVWGAVCGMFGLTEAMGNHLYIKWKKSKDPKYESQTLKMRFDDLTKEVQELKAKNVTGINAWFRRLQLQNMKRGKSLFETAEKKAKEYAKLEGKAWLKTGGELARKVLKQAEEFSEKSAGGKKIYLGYIWSFTMASLGGAAQTVIAALMQTKVDKAHGLK